MKLIGVVSGSATAYDGYTDYVLTVTDADDGSGTSYTIPFTYHADDGAEMSNQLVAWLSAHEGAIVIAPYSAPVVYPDLLPYQFRAMLSISGNTDKLNNYIAGLVSPAKDIAQAKLDYSLSFQRDNDLVLQAQTALGLTDDQLNTLWLQAAAIS